MATTIDGNGIVWFVATGPQSLIRQSRNRADDKRWSGDGAGVSTYGYEVTSIFSFSGVSGDGHFALKHWGPNHTAPCGYEESGECCCWYDTGIRANGDVQLQTERPHPNNDNFSATLNMSNIGVSMNNRTIGLKWLVYPRTPGGSAQNGGIKLKMWVDTSGLQGGRPQNQWRLVYDITDTGQILGDGYEAPDLHDIENRVSNTANVIAYGGGLHWRKLQAVDSSNDVPGGGQNPPPSPSPNQPSNVDNTHGVKMIYPTKVSTSNTAQTWFLGTNPDTDGRLVSTEETISKEGDYFVVRNIATGNSISMDVLTSTGTKPSTNCTISYAQLEAAGFRHTSNDFKNTETTIFIYPQEVFDMQNGTFLICSRVSDSGGIGGCCDAFRYGVRIFLTNTGTNAGRIQFFKTLKGSTFSSTSVVQTTKSHFYRSWTGFKFITYNTLGPNNENWVVLELWICPSDVASEINSNWIKVLSFVDTGVNFGAGGDGCVGDPAQAITWGSYHHNIIYVANDLRFKKWSIREIDPTASFPGDPNDNGSGGGVVIEEIYNDLIILYNINSDSDGCLCQDPGFTPPPSGGEEPGQGENQSIYDIDPHEDGKDDLRMANIGGRSSVYLQVGTEIRASGSPLYNKNIKRIEWYLKKVGNPKGLATVVIRKGTDNTIGKTLGTINVQDLTDNFEYYAVENTGVSYTTVADDKVLIEYQNGDEDDFIRVRVVEGDTSNDTKVVTRSNTQGDGDYSERDKEAVFRAFA